MIFMIEMQPTDLQKYDRDLNAAENILRRGISELWSGCQTEYNSAILACTQESYAV